MKNPVLYRYEWSTTLDEELVQTIEQIGGRRWDLGSSAMSIASRLQQWINKRAKKHGLKRVNTSTGRSALTTRLYQEFEKKNISETMFIALLDHKPDTSLRIYQRN